MGKTAYLIIDMSNDFVHEKGALTAGAPARVAAGRIYKTALDFLSRGDTVVIAMDAHYPDDSHFKLWPVHNVKGTWGSEGYGDIGRLMADNNDDDNLIVIGKSEYDAFYKTGLGGMLGSRGIDCVRLSGVCTDICVYLTAYGAYKEGFRTEVDPRECATFTDNGDVFIKSMETNFKTVILKGEADDE